MTATRLNDLKVGDVVTYHISWWKPKDGPRATATGTVAALRPGNGKTGKVFITRVIDGHRADCLIPPGRIIEVHASAEVHASVAAPTKVSKELAEEIESRVATQLESQDGWEEGETRTQEEMEVVALEDIIALGRDAGGLFEKGLLPEFAGSPAWVAEMKAKQKAYAADMARQEVAWLKLWREAKRELKRRTGEGE